MSEKALKPVPTAIICAVLLTAFITTAWLAIRTKSPGYDEPYHAVSAWLQLRHLDFRLDNEDPPLWQYWASLPNGKRALNADFTSEIWKTMPQSVVHQWYWGVQTLYRTPGNDPEKLIAHCRVMMLIVAGALGVLICVWAWQLGGGIAAIIAAILFCLDPNFLAHSPLMKNDIAFAVSMFALAFVLWKAGKQLTIARLSWIGILCAVTLTVKFSGIIAVLLVPLLMCIRALLPPRSGSIRWRLFLVLIVTLCAMLMSYVGIWAVYGFRFRPTPERNVWLNLTQLTDQIRINAVIADYHGRPPPGVTPAEALPLPARAAVFANQHGLFPQAFLAGFLFTYSNGLVRFAYANGEISPVGWWWYFPFAILVKTPIATLLVMLVTAIAVLRGLFKTRLQRRLGPRTGSGVDMWAAICLLTPIVLFLTSAMVSNLNIGLRHVMCIYPFLFVAMGVTIAKLWKAQGTKSRVGISMIGVLLAVETLWAFPNYIAFFNVISTTIAGGKLSLLGDSNLDWGQDLPLLARWQRGHPKEKLYLCYFGYADPKYYGIRYTPLPGGYHYDSTPHFAEEQPYSPSVLAISASNLQGFLLDPELRGYYQKWANRKPIAVLGDTIYLYEFDPMHGTDGY